MSTVEEATEGMTGGMTVPLEDFDRVLHVYDERKKSWGEGPWSAEPDKVQWVDKDTGLDCLAVRNPRLGHWCGYVGVAEGHCYFGKECDSVDASVHGGLTFSDLCDEENPEGICHVPLPGRPAKVWWLGFDCAHSGDLCPGDGQVYNHAGFEDLAAIHLRDRYRTLHYVVGQCRDLAAQLAAPWGGE